jgi:hypothetical protein
VSLPAIIEQPWTGADVDWYERSYYRKKDTPWERRTRATPAKERRTNGYEGYSGKKGFDAD